MLVGHRNRLGWQTMRQALAAPRSTQQSETILVHHGRGVFSVAPAGRTKGEAASGRPQALLYFRARCAALTSTGSRRQQSVNQVGATYGV
jgi:hypothetical protein